MGRDTDRAEAPQISVNAAIQSALLVAGQPATMCSSSCTSAEQHGHTEDMPMVSKQTVDAKQGIQRGTG